MNLLQLQVNWVDLAILILLVVGVVRGRRRGMSQELLDVLKWFLIVVVAAFVYEPGGRLLAQTAVFGLLYSYVGVYALVLLTILVTFSFVRSWAGDKLVSSDAFGAAEYYLGMLGGGFRYGCVLLVVMAFLNARYFAPHEVHAQERFQQENFGATYFPTVSSLQRHVFSGSLTGRFVRDYLKIVLIRPTSPADSPRGPTANIVRGRERELNDVLAK